MYSNFLKCYYMKLIYWERKDNLINLKLKLVLIELKKREKKIQKKQQITEHIKTEKDTS